MPNSPEGLRNTLLIARRQLGAIRQDGTVVFGLGLVIALGLVAALGARHHAANETEQRDRYQTMVDRQWVEQPERHPHRVIHYGFLVFREQAPLEFVDPGVSDYAGTSLYLEGHRQNTANFGEARHATGMSRFGRLTPASVLALLLPLLVVVAGFAAVSAEREGGTLGVLLTQGATPAQILAGKVLATGAVAALASIPVALAVSVMAGPGLGSPASAMRLGSLAAIYAIYLAGWVLVTVLVSAVRTSSRSALAQLLALWVVICVATPRMAASVAGALYPLPSRAELTAQVEAALNEVGDSHRPDDPFFRSLREEYLERYQVAAVEDLPVNWRGVLSRESESLTSRVFEDHRQELVAIFARTGSWHGRDSSPRTWRPGTCRWASPVAARRRWKRSSPRPRRTATRSFSVSTNSTSARSGTRTTGHNGCRANTGGSSPSSRPSRRPSLERWRTVPSPWPRSGCGSACR